MQCLRRLLGDLPVDFVLLLEVESLHESWVCVIFLADNPVALYNVGAQYFAGKGVELSFERAAEYFEKAAILQFPPAQVGEQIILQPLPPNSYYIATPCYNIVAL